MSVVALVFSDGVPVYELAAPCGIFGSNRAAPDWYELWLCGPSGARVDRWFRVETDHSYADLVSADTVVVPACHDAGMHPPADLVDAVRTAYERGARVMSICTGAFVLAEAGLLDGRRATTHWMHAATLAARYPAITADPNVLYVDEGQVLTSAGKAAGTDLCLHVVRRDHGEAVANEIARRLVTAPHREGGQAQYIETAASGGGQHDLVPVMDWAREHLDQPITIDDLAGKANMGTRTLNRHFHARVGTNPLRWLQHQRVRRAQQLLELTDHTIDQVAQRAGFGTAAVLRRHFRQALGTTPDAYRRTFASRRR